jgi:hypothetical protein
LAETDVVAVAFAVSLDGDGVAVLQEFPLAPVQHRQGLGALPGQFQKGTERIRRLKTPLDETLSLLFWSYLSTDCPARHQVSWLDIAPGDGVMGKLLLGSPVQIFVI